ncbi:MAG TPA: tetratricopeptide repeat protein, partial [Actinomycetota bacterium]|nr:tetratricopeptide repeat protein [Actinomycetota bacterium]
MQRTTALIGIVGLVVGATYIVRADGPSESLRPVTVDEVAEVAAGAGGSGTGVAPGAGARGEIDRLIEVYEDQVRRQASALDYTFLGELYLSRGRLTGDVGTYARAEEALSRALDIYPEDPEARALLASVRFTTHDFTGAERLAEELLADDPHDVGALAIAGDARLELGDYTRAAAAYDEMGRRLSGAAAVSVRRARLAFLLGDPGAARRMARAAERSAEAGGL